MQIQSDRMSGFNFEGTDCFGTNNFVKKVSKKTVWTKTFARATEPPFARSRDLAALFLKSLGLMKSS